MSAHPVLSIGNKNYSSWSMRPWLALRWGKIAFKTHVIPLGPRGQGPNPEIAAVSPTGTVPVLRLANGEVIWDTLSICEWAAEQAPTALLWPNDPTARALARSAVAEMHAGFAPLRQNMPMNIRRRKSGHIVPEPVTANIARIDALLSGLRARFDTAGTGWLFGRPTIADAFFAPVATRFRTYGASVSPATQAWCDTLFADPYFQDWERDALAETWTIAETEAA